MMKPEFARLARLYGPTGPALFASVDQTTSAANAALVTEAAVRGFPTFQVRP